MTAEQIFSITNAIAALGWVVLIFAGRKRWAAGLVSGVLIPLLLAAVYVALIIRRWGESSGGFGSLEQVSALFSNPWMLLVGWVHYLAFDLFVGSWEVRDAEIHSISHLVVIPCLILTFLFGPTGLLVYMCIRGLRAGTLNIQHFPEQVHKNVR